MDQINYFSAHKFISKKIEGELETRKYHVVKTDLPVKLIIDLYDDNYEDDWEACHFGWGMFGDYNGDLYSIDVEKFLIRCEEMFKEILIENEEEELKEEYLNDWKILIKELKKFKGHTLYPEKNTKTEGEQDE